MSVRALAAQVVAAAGITLVAAGTDPVTVDRLNRADGDVQNWLTYGRTYRALRYSPLDQIDASNVHSLKAAWAFQLGVSGGMQSTPLVADGVMYVIGPGNRVFALDASTGGQQWQYIYRPGDDSPTTPAATAVINRGVALGHGNVYFGTQDNFVVALDAATGKELWRTNVEDKRKFGCSINAAPLLVKDLVVVGSTGGDTAHRGHLVAFDAKTGKQRWRFNVIPGPGERGNESWPDDTWMYGGGAPWLTGSYDPDLDLIYWGTGNASSDYYGEHRKGDDLYTASIVALRASTGELAWHFQPVPHDVWDYDAAYECILVDLPFNGRTRKLLLQPNKTGYTYVLDRTNGEFLTAWKYVDNVTWTTGLDAKGVPQGRREPQLDRTIVVCPNYGGGRSFNQATYNPKTGLLYNVGIEWCGEYTAHPQEMTAGRAWFSGTHRIVAPPAGDITTHLDAFEPLTGRKIWTYNSRYPLMAALVSTAGDLVFTGDPEGNFFALHARTGKKLWSFQTGSGNRGGPIAYSVNGRQFIATPSGWGSALATVMAQEIYPEMRTFRPGATLFAFALPEAPEPSSAQTRGGDGLTTGGAAAASVVSTSVWSGLYTQAQAKHGEDCFMKACASCHADDLRGTGMAGPLVGDAFLRKWDAHTLDELFNRIRETMPADDPASLSAQAYADLIAFVLQSNHIPSGDAELRPDPAALSKIAVTRDRK